MYLPSTKVVKVILRADFRVLKDNRLPGISTLIDGLSRQASIEVDEAKEGEQPNAEAHFVHCLTALNQETPRMALPQTTVDDTQVPKSFAEVVNLRNGQLRLIVNTRH